jgi:hypothetical protein
MNYEIQHNIEVFSACMTETLPMLTLLA